MNAGTFSWRLRMVFASVVMSVAAASALRAAETTTVPFEVTFSKDIAPILKRSCQNCHQPNSVAPMSLITYKEVRPWARAIKERTSRRDKQGAMPPWFIEKNIGIQRYKNDPSLSDRKSPRLPSGQTAVHQKAIRRICRHPSRWSTAPSGHWANRT